MGRKARPYGRRSSRSAPTSELVPMGRKARPYGRRSSRSAPTSELGRAPVVPAQGDARGDTPGQGARAGGGGKGDHGDLAAGAEIVDRPVVDLGVVAEVG